MPNLDVKRGLRPARMASGTVYNGSANPYYVPATNAAPLFIGDPVIVTGEANADGIASVERAAAAGPVTGVIVGFQPETERQVLGYLPATTEGIALVVDEPGVEFEIQANAQITAAQIGLNASMAVVDGDTVLRRSNVELDVATLAATATLPLKLIGAKRTVGNDPFDAGGNAKVRVRLNNVTADADSAGV